MLIWVYVCKVLVHEKDQKHAIYLLKTWQPQAKMYGSIGNQ